MIGYIKGKVLSHSDNVVLLENGGIGYEITCSASALNKLVENKQGEVFTYLAVREDGVSLFGFISIEEKNMFLKLITVSGVGPKMGITILSGLNLHDLALAIAGSDVKTLSAVKGLGKKTAERIILELRENISSLDLPEKPSSKKAVKEVKVTTPEEDDAVIALMSLGYNRSESVAKVEIARQEGAKSLEEIITVALRS